MDLKVRHLISDVAVIGQPGVIGARTKCCKTLLALDMALSVSAGIPFLGHFVVPQAGPVVMLSFESGGATLRENFYRMGLARGLTPDEVADLPVYWQFEHRPCLSDPSHINALGELVSKVGAKLVIDDPLNLTLFAPGDVPRSGDLFYMGQRLAGLGDLCRTTGVTLYVLHHFRKTGVPSDEEPASLDELSMSGVAEFVRQWILLQRRQPYADDGQHDLWCRIGGMLVTPVSTACRSTRAGTAGRGRLASSEWPTCALKSSSSGKTARPKNRANEKKNTPAACSGRCNNFPTATRPR